MKKSLFLLIIILFTGLFSFSQQQFTAKHPDRPMYDFGFGIGMDYGGVIGLQGGFSPLPYLEAFGAVGYYLVGPGWNVGCKGRLIPADRKHVARPYGKVMFGTNSATKCEGLPEYDKVFLGFTFGAGLELRFGGLKNNGLNMDLNFPLRTPEFYTQMNKMKDDHRVDIKNDVLPVAFSIGYHFSF